MKKQLTGYLIDVAKKDAKVITIEPELEEYYKTLNCDLITITYRDIGGKEFCIIADDEGLLKSNPVVSAISESYWPMLVGNLLVVSADDNAGDFASISEDDTKLIEQNIVNLTTMANGTYLVLMLS